MTEPAPSDSHRDLPVGRWTWLPTVDAAFLAVVVAAGVVLRFVTRSPLWLDESLSVNISRLPLGDIPDALRHDGHPPLFYFLLHGWMKLFGTGDVAVRSLSGVFGVALIPLVFLAARRLGGRRAAWAATALLALNPYALRYATETRMYSLVACLAVSLWLLVDDARQAPRPARLVGVALLSGLLLLTHYWAMWFLAGMGLWVLWRAVVAHRAGDHDDRRAYVLVAVALAAGGLLFVPWLGVLLYQSAHTGTPWAGPVRPAEMITLGFIDFGGGNVGESTLLGMLLAVLAVLGVFGRELSTASIELDLRTREAVRPIAVIVALTLVVASAAGFATHSAFATRYLAVVFPLVVVITGLGLARFGGPVWFRAAVGVVVLLSTVGAYKNVTVSRTQARVTADVIEAAGPAADQYVLYCPDQLGPAVSRVLPAGIEQATYPRFDPPQRVDWVDYQDVLDRTDPADFARQALKRAGDRTIWFVWNGGYKTHEGTCQQVINALLAARSGTEVQPARPESYFENEGLWRFPPNP